MNRLYWFISSVINYVKTAHETYCFSPVVVLQLFLCCCFGMGGGGLTGELKEFCLC